MIYILVGIVIVFVIHSIIPTYYNKIFNKKIIRKSKYNDRAVLTFDDGPDERYIYKLCDVLAENDVKAIFFMVAESAKKNKSVIRYLLENGHKIGVHSWQHKNAMLYSYLYTKRDFENSLMIMRSLGVKELFYRPPWGHTNIFSNYFIKKYELKTVLWDVMAEDWKASSTPKEISDKLVKRTKKNSIICLHDAGENSGGAVDAPLNTIEGLRIALPILKKKGIKFTIDI